MPRNCREPPCRTKDPPPTKRTYKDKTIEFGIIIDRHLYNNMAVSKLQKLKSQLMLFKNLVKTLLFLRKILKHQMKKQSKML